MRTTTRVQWVDHLYPILLAATATVSCLLVMLVQHETHTCSSPQAGYCTCQWFHVHDVRPPEKNRISTYLSILLSNRLHCPLQLETRKPVDDMSLKYMLTAVPQLFAGLLLLHYARTFRKPASAFKHELLVESCVHQSIAMLLQGSILHSTAHMTLSLCCTFPTLWCVVKLRCFGLTMLPGWLTVLLFLLSVMKPREHPELRAREYHPVPRARAPPTAFRSAAKVRADARDLRARVCALEHSGSTRYKGARCATPPCKVCEL